MEADPVGHALPRQDLTVESAHRLVLDGDRYLADHDDPGMRMQVPVSGDFSTAFDGRRIFSRYYHQGRDQPTQLTAETATDNRGYSGIAARPLSLWCRGSAREPFGRPDQVVAPVTLVDVEGATTLEVRFDRPKGGTTTYRIESGRDHVVRRVRLEVGDSVEVTDIEYRDEPGIGWMPAGWTTVKTRSGGRLVQRTWSEVTSVRVGGPVADEIYRLDPLPGESFYDADSRRSYLVRPDGTLAEADDPEQLPTADGPPGPPPAWPGRWLVRYVVLPGLLAGSLGVVVLRRRSRPPHTPSL